MGIKKEYIDRYIELMNNFRRTDYITDKLVEAIVEYIIHGDSSKVLSLCSEYESAIEQRKAWRAEINELQEKLKNKE